MARGPQCLCVFALVMPLAVPLVAGGQTPPKAEQALIEFFEKKVRPVLVANCYNCHSADTNAKNGLRVDNRNGLVRGGDRGPAIVPGHPEQSLLIQAIRQTHAKVKMPPEKELSSQQIADLTQWVRDGAAWPGLHSPSSVGEPDAAYAEIREQHWAWQPLHEPATPKVKDDSWAHDPIDLFILAGLETSELKPAKAADPLTLIRRLTFDITGLPPTPAEVEAFVNAWKLAKLTPRADAGSGAEREVVEALVDRLLASPAYGERWGRHWLDVARYAESTGSSRNMPYPHAWRYRDYVIDAMNNDKPYDRFLLEQIAGDLLPAESRGDEQLIATGFLALGMRDVN